MSDSKINIGNYFEDFKLNEKIIHPLPRTISDGDVSLYIALTGSRFALNSSVEMAKTMGYKDRPIDDILLFHIVFGKSVIDISINAIANLGYAEVIFPTPVFVGDTVRLESTIIGLKENSNGKSGNVYVHSQGYNQHNELILSFKRWVMVHKKDVSVQAGIHEIPTMESIVPVNNKLNIPLVEMIDIRQTGNAYFWEDYVKGERLDHPEGMTIDNSDHTLATKLYQNNAKLHFDDHMMKSEKVGQRLMYGGHVISICRSISFNGLGNALWLYAINSGTHANPTFGGDTLYCYSEVLDIIEHERKDIGLLRLRTIGLKNITPKEVSQPRNEENKYHPYVVLDLDYTVIIPRRIQSI
ncbi:MAG: MaoC family dehydratase [Gammaproteobacteria bacterium]|nr:MaoC family dehydratase [Gammaproteobacteria bacterium]